VNIEAASLGFIFFCNSDTSFTMLFPTLINDLKSSLSVVNPKSVAISVLVLNLEPSVFFKIFGYSPHPTII